MEQAKDSQKSDKEIPKSKSNIMREIKIERVVLNCGALADKLEKSKKLLGLITGKKVKEVASTKRIPAFGIRPGLPTGCIVTLRGKEKGELLKRLFEAVENKIKKKQIKENHFSFGIKEYLEIPGMEYNRDIGILGLDEMCCGETSRRLGHEYLFQMMVEQNLELFASIKFERIVTACPHCFNTLKNEYPQFGGQYKVQHLTEFLAEKSIHEYAISPNGNGLEGRLTFHDSCYLGRYNQILDEPRQLLENANVDHLEMSKKGYKSFCCGGGGGQMWMETDPNTRINHRRLNDALEIGAEIVTTACPYCLLMFDDAIRSKGLGDQIRVMDVAEVLVNKLGVDQE